MFQSDTVISVVCIYYSKLGLFKHMHPTLGRKRLPVLNMIQWWSSQHFGKLVNRWRCSLAPHPDIRSVEWGGLWIKDKYSIFDNKLQNSHYAQIHTYILSNKLLRSDSVQSTGLNESKKKKEKIQESWGPDGGKGRFLRDQNRPRMGTVGTVTGRPHLFHLVDQICK